MRSTGLILLLLFGSGVYAMDVDKAYRLIPHKRTVFQLNQSEIPNTEAEQVARLLSFAEKAMVERVDAMVNGPDKTDYKSRINNVLWQIDHLQLPSRAEAARDHIVEAVQQHRAYFDLHDATGSNVKASQQQLVQSSHRHLISAYQQLMQNYPMETKHNKQAFFDYLCALDFI